MVLLPEAQEELPLADPVLTPVVYLERVLPDELGEVKMRKILVCQEMGLTIVLTKTLQKAIYGKVKQGVGATLAASPDTTLLFGEEPQMYAVKCMPWATIQRLRATHAEDPLREVSTLQLLQNTGGGHPNVLPIVAAFTDANSVYIVTPFCGGGDIFAAVAPPDGIGAYPEDEARPLFRQIMRGVQHLQQRFLCHHDMSLENIILDHSKRHPFIMDFGMSLLVPHEPNGDHYLSTPNPRRGKVSYMAPEVFQGLHPYDSFATDVFSCGAILFLILLGSPPWSSPAPTDRLFECITGGNLATLLASWGRTLSPQATSLMQWMLLYDPRRRPTVQQVLAHEWMQEAPTLTA